MKLNISFPAASCQKCIEVGKGYKFSIFYETHKVTEVAADALGEVWKRYVVRISGGNDKILTHGRVQLLISKEHSRYRPRRTGERKPKSVHRCIVDASQSVLNWPL
ncbi:40S ribosomal protein S6-like [Onychomys torridus]|uniref:40S ribosomal protein S6-like n=1 Tax=Onychomys torridus TaxID=38674 RepID=UPI00167FA304|nr:40S ribosomal protein S6-like [Onychomys torridus]